MSSSNGRALCGARSSRRGGWASRASPLEGPGLGCARSVMKPESANYGSSLLVVGAFLGVYALFDVLPIVLPKTDVVRGLRWGDLVDAPLLFLLAAAYVLLGRQAGLWRSNVRRAANAVALVVLIQGQGIHLAANAISAYLDPSSPGWRPAYFLDEHWGHTER